MKYGPSDRRLLLIEGCPEVKGTKAQAIVFLSPTERMGFIYGHLAGLDTERWCDVKYVAPGYWKDLLDAYGEEYSRNHIAHHFVEDTDITEWLQGKKEDNAA